MLFALLFGIFFKSRGTACLSGCVAALLITAADTELHTSDAPKTAGFHSNLAFSIEIARATRHRKRDGHLPKYQRAMSASFLIILPSFLLAYGATTGEFLHDDLFERVNGHRLASAQGLVQRNWLQKNAVD